MRSNRTPALAGGIYTSEWNDVYEAYFTPVRVKELQDKRKEAKKELKAFEATNKETVRLPTLEDIDAFLRQKCVVVVYLE